jgi:hypothetical protein
MARPRKRVGFLNMEFIRFKFSIELKLNMELDNLISWEKRTIKILTSNKGVVLLHSYVEMVPSSFFNKHKNMLHKFWYQVQFKCS